jgi:hypothetical protein
MSLGVAGPPGSLLNFAILLSEPFAVDKIESLLFVVGDVVDRAALSSSFSALRLARERSGPHQDVPV